MPCQWAIGLNLTTLKPDLLDGTLKVVDILIEGIRGITVDAFEVVIEGISITGQAIPRAAL